MSEVPLYRDVARVCRSAGSRGTEAACYGGVGGRRLDGGAVRGAADARGRYLPDFNFFRGPRLETVLALVSLVVPRPRVDLLVLWAPLTFSRTHILVSIFGRTRRMCVLKDW